MNEPIDYSLFDRPEISTIMFYPQRVWSQAPPGSTDHMVPVGQDVAISTRFYVHDKQAPSILFFHGNGEIACQYDDIAPRYAAAGANLFAADFRGYGQSGGQPSFSTLIYDARAV
ncbi:MAG: alpha/beta hydrolase, partial [Chloroflexi bacterium]|nr:alpha/beta hydrolase [Chloroflexota bacterium]